MRTTWWDPQNRPMLAPEHPSLAALDPHVLHQLSGGEIPAKTRCWSKLGCRITFVPFCFEILEVGWDVGVSLSYLQLPQWRRWLESLQSDLLSCCCQVDFWTLDFSCLCIWPVGGALAPCCTWLLFREASFNNASIWKVRKKEREKWPSLGISNDGCSTTRPSYKI